MSRLFLSCVNAEFADLRIALTRDLKRPDVDVRSHDEVVAFNSGRTTLEKLDEYLATCDGVVHLVGDASGSAVSKAELYEVLRQHPDLPDRVPEVQDLLDPRATWNGSYAQWEAYLTLHRIRKGEPKQLFIYRYLSEVKERNELDAPTALDQQRQAAHYARLSNSGRDRTTFSTHDELRIQVINHLLELLSRPRQVFRAEPSTLWRLQAKPGGVFEGRDDVFAYLNGLWSDVLAEAPDRARIVSLVAIGGAGKTTVVSRWKDALFRQQDHSGVERYFDWSFYSQGTRTDREGHASAAADSTAFVAAALSFFDDAQMADSVASPWAKGTRLAALVAQYRTLLVLDGLEPLQYPPGPHDGELKDDAIRALFEGLRIAGRGLCVVTSRQRIRDLVPTEATTTPRRLLNELTDKAGAAVLRQHQVLGPQEELEKASREVKGHALTLCLMGRYLRAAFDPPDIAKRDRFSFSEADAETTNGHAFRMFAAYERWLEQETSRRSWFTQKPRGIDRTALAILRVLGLFDRPATPDCLSALCTPPIIEGLTEPLVGLNERAWNLAVDRLVNLDLIEQIEFEAPKVSGYSEHEATAEIQAGQDWFTTNLGEPRPFEFQSNAFFIRASLNAHPLLREYFGARLLANGVAPVGHARLFEHLVKRVPYWPEGREGLVPLYQAVSHGCRAGRHRDALQVYVLRIQRGMRGRFENYASQKLGLGSLNLAVIASFFDELWQVPSTKLPVEWQAWLLNEVAFYLEHGNRAGEALPVLEVALAMAESQRAWLPARRQLASRRRAGDAFRKERCLT